MPEPELPWAGPPKAHLRWPAMLFGVFGISVGILIVAIGLYALLDYSAENTPVVFESPDRPHPEAFVRSSTGERRQERYLSEPESERPRVVTPTPLPVSSTNASNTSSSSAADEARQHAKSRQRTLVAKGNEVLRLLDECDQEVKLWTESVQPLLENETGKRIAGDESLVRQFRVVYRRDRPSAQLASELRTSLTDLMAPMQAALKDDQDVRLPREELSDEISKLYVEAKTLRDSLREPRKQIDSIADVAKSLPPQAKSLRQAMTDSQNAERLAETRRMEQETTRATREAAERLAVAEAKRIEDEANAAIAKQQAEAEHARLVAKAKTPEVRRLLTPFISKGYMQYRGGFVRDANEGPMSYKGILDSGALNQTTIGLTRLNTLAADPRGLAIGNDRPGLWNYVGYPEGWSKSDQDHMRKVQDLLRELGPTLVELEMLAP